MISALRTSAEHAIIERVVLVDEADREVGSEEKLAAHVHGRLHRAFSILIFDPAGRMLLQKRARSKYHSGGLWTNSCCGHPRPGERVEAAAARRLFEEMGIRCALEPRGSFLYRAELPCGLIEHEIDHVLSGSFDGVPFPDPAEADDWRWIAPDELSSELLGHPDRFTPWFLLCLKLVGAPQARNGGRAAS